MKEFLLEFLRRTVFAWCSRLNRCLSHNPQKIMFYSDLGFRDNVKALYDYVIQNNYNKTYSIICATNDYKKHRTTSIENVRFVSKLSGFFHFFSAGYVFYCFGKIPLQPGKNQTVVQLWHGTPFKDKSKDMKDNYTSDKLFFTHVLASSKHLIRVLSYMFSFPEDKVIVCGQPRNDALFSEKKYDLGNYEKLVLWTPTFRASKIMGNETKHKARLLPIIEKEDLPHLQDFLQQHNMKIIVKLHPVQNVADYNIVEMKHFVFLSHAEFVKRSMDLYLLAAQSDALITDYSSIFSDYLLLNRPIAFTEDDLDDYQSTRGFSVSDMNRYKAGQRIKSKEDFYSFLENVAKNVDDFVEDRRQANLLLNDYVDNHSSQRVLDTVGIKKA